MSSPKPGNNHLGLLIGIARMLGVLAVTIAPTMLFVWALHWGQSIPS